MHSKDMPQKAPHFAFLTILPHSELHVRFCNGNVPAMFPQQKQTRLSASEAGYVSAAEME